jgi:hypothetical protein
LLDRLRDGQNRPIEGRRVRARVGWFQDQGAQGKESAAAFFGPDQRRCVSNAPELDYCVNSQNAQPLDAYALPFSLSEPSDASGLAQFKNLLFTEVGRAADRSVVRIVFAIHLESDLYASTRDVMSSVDASDAILVRSSQTTTLLGYAISAQASAGSAWQSQPTATIEFAAAAGGAQQSLLYSLRYASLDLVGVLFRGPGMGQNAVGAQCTDGYLTYERMSEYDWYAFESKTRKLTNAYLDSTSCLRIDSESVAQLSGFDDFALTDAVPDSRDDSCDVTSNERGAAASSLTVSFQGVGYSAGLQQPMKTRISGDYSECSDPIELVVVVQDVSLTSQVPKDVYVYESFVVEALCTAAGGVPMAFTTVNIDIVAPTPGSNVRLAKDSAISDAKGRLRFLVLFLSGKPGVYSLVFRVPNVGYASQQSDSFTLYNPIGSIAIVQQPSQVLRVTSNLAGKIPEVTIPPVRIKVNASFSRTPWWVPSVYENIGSSLSVRMVGLNKQRNTINAAFDWLEQLINEQMNNVVGSYITKKLAVAQDKLLYKATLSEVSMAQAIHEGNGTYRIDWIDFTASSLGDFAIVYQAWGFESEPEQSQVIQVAKPNAWETQGQKTVLGLIFSVPALIIYYGNSASTHRIASVASVAIAVAVTPTAFGVFSLTGDEYAKETALPVREWFSRLLILAMLIGTVVTCAITMLGRYDFMYYHRKFWLENQYTLSRLPQTLISAHHAVQKDPAMWCSKVAAKAAPLTLVTGIKAAFPEYVETIKSVFVRSDDCFTFPLRLQVALGASCFFVLFISIWLYNGVPYI